jgi:hypothetical protein
MATTLYKECGNCGKAYPVEDPECPNCGMCEDDFPVEDETWVTMDGKPVDL